MAGRGSSFIPWRRGGGAGVGGLCAAQEAVLQQGLLSHWDLCLLLPPFPLGFGFFLFPLLRQNSRPTWAQTLDRLGPARRPGSPEEGPFCRSPVTTGPSAAELPLSWATLCSVALAHCPRYLLRRVELLSTSPREPVRVPEGNSGECRVGTVWERPPPRCCAVLVK